MTYKELGFGLPNKDITIDKRTKSVATIDLASDIQFRLAMLYMDLDKIASVHKDVFKQHEVIDDFVRLVSKLLTDAVAHSGIGLDSIDYTCSLFTASIDAYITKDAIQCYMQAEDISYNQLHALIHELTSNIIVMLHTFGISREEANCLPCSLDIDTEPGGFECFSGWMTHKTIGINVLVLLEF